VFYMGDDARFEYVYRFVSDALWGAQDACPCNGQSRLALGDKYLNHGTLYVARFHADGSGEWLPLTPEARAQDGRTLGEIFGNLAGILLDTRSAADHVGATPMDRPEWGAVHPGNGDVYLTLTNNTRRTADNTNAANPRTGNANGHIIRWHDDAGSTRFMWDIFVYGSHADADTDTNRSGLTVDNQLASLDGIAFDARGILCFVGPNEAEITGFAFTPDHRTIFINIQHPANWPAYASRDATAAPIHTVRPRSATVVIQKCDGGQIGI